MSRLIVPLLLAALFASEGFAQPTGVGIEVAGAGGGEQADAPVSRLSRAAARAATLEAEAARGDVNARFALARLLYRDPLTHPQAYAQMRLAAMAGLPAAAKALAHMRRRVSVADRVQAVEILVAALPSAPAPAFALADDTPAQAAPQHLVAAWWPSDEAGAPDVAASARPPIVPIAPVRMAPSVSGRHAVVPVAPSDRTGRSQAAIGAAPTPAVSSPGNWIVQLGAFRRAGAAERHWAMVSRHAALFGAVRPRYVVAGGFTRLQLSGLDRARAQVVCARIRNACLAIAPRPAARLAAGYPIAKQI